jgi:hypothetical protein
MKSGMRQDHPQAQTNLITDNEPSIDLQVAVEAQPKPSPTTETRPPSAHEEPTKQQSIACDAAPLHPPINPVVAAAASAPSGSEIAATVIQHSTPAREIPEQSAHSADNVLRSPTPGGAEVAVRTPPPCPVHLSRLAGNPQQCEMHIGLRTTAFGTVEVHTFVRDNTVGVSIASDRGELRQWFSSEMPTLAASLRQQDLQLDTLQFFHTGMQAGLGASSQFSQQHQGWTQQHSASLAAPELPETGASAAASLTDISVEPDGRLNLHA